MNLTWKSKLKRSLMRFAKLFFSANKGFSVADCRKQVLQVSISHTFILNFKSKRLKNVHGLFTTKTSLPPDLLTSALHLCRWCHTGPKCDFQDFQDLKLKRRTNIGLDRMKLRLKSFETEPSWTSGSTWKHKNFEAFWPTVPPPRWFTITFCKSCIRADLLTRF